MDWSHLRENIGKLAKNGVEASSKAITASQGYIRQAAEYSREKMRSSHLYIRNAEQFELFLQEKRGVLVCVRENSPESETLMLEIPVFFTKAWMDIATFRVLEYPADPDVSLPFAESIQIQSFPTTLLFMGGEEIRRETRLVPVQEIPKFIQF